MNKEGVIEKLEIEISLQDIKQVVSVNIGEDVFRSQPEKPSEGRRKILSSPNILIYVISEQQL